MPQPPRNSRTFISVSSSSRNGDQQPEDLRRPRLPPQRKMFRTRRSVRRMLLLSSQNDGTQAERLRSFGVKHD